MAKDGQYHLACAKYFEVVHNKPASKPLLHPNAYFAESRAVLTEDDNANKGKRRKGKEKRIIKKSVTEFVSLCMYNLFSTDVDSKDKFPQSTIGTPGGGSSRRNDRYSTPSRNTDFTGTPKRNDRYSTPSRNTDGTGTPLRKVQRTSYQTPSKRDVQMTPVNIAELLNNDDLAEFMDME